MTFRKVLFWTHLTAGCLAGVVIFVMCVTGVMLAWKRQILNFADRGFRHAPAKVRLTPEELLAKVAEARHERPASLTLRSDPEEPWVVDLASGISLYIHPGSGAILGEASPPVRLFFRRMEDVHRWLAVGVPARAVGRGVTGACNLVFLGLLLSGLYLWLPKKWNRQNLRSAIWFRRGKTGRARDWNWHNTVGIWCVAPLLVVVTTGVVMSYPWANNLVYRITGTEAPKPAARRGSKTEVSSFEGLDRLWARARSQVPGWRSMSVRLPKSAKEPVQFQIDSGDGGRPDLKGQLTFRGDVVLWEPFSGSNAGRRLRSWIRFSHTGEAGGVLGETIAAAAALGGALLVWTGISLAIRRLARARTKAAVPGRASQAA